MTEKNPLSRREVLAAASSGLTLALAGCSTEVDEKDIPPKDFEMTFPEGMLTGLEEFDRVRERKRPDLPKGEIVVTIGSNLYEDIGVEEEMNKQFQFGGDIPYRVVGPTYIDIAAGDVTSTAIGGLRGEINKQMDKRIDEMVKSRLKEFEGVDDVETTVDETLHKEYEAEVELPEIDLSEYSMLVQEETIIKPDPVLFTGGYEMFEVSDSLDYFGVVWVEPEDEYTLTIPEEKFPEKVQEQMNGDKEIPFKFEEYQAASLEDMRDWIESQAESGERQV